MEKVEMPSSSVRKRIIPVLEHIRDHWAGHQAVRLMVDSPSPSCAVLGLDCLHSPSAVPLLEHLDTEFTPFFNLTHMVFTEKEEKWWKVLGKSVYLWKLVWLSLEEREDTSHQHHCSLPCTYTHTNMCMLICTDQLLPVLITAHNTIHGYQTTVSVWKVLYVAMSIKVCLEEQVKFSQKITDVGSKTWFSEVVSFRKWRSSKPY